MKTFLNAFIIVLVSLGCMSSLRTEVRLAGIFSDNMVLQRHKPIPIWGYAAPGEKIMVTLKLQKKICKTNKSGKWMVQLDAENEGGPFTLIVTGKKSYLKLENILIGDVWLCSGQSNMEWTVGQSDNAKSEIATGSNPFIRHIKIEHKINSVPEDTLETYGWKIGDAQNVADFTGVGYYFAKHLVDSLRIPIGLINASWGGTNIETWISRSAFDHNEELKYIVKGQPEIHLDSLSKLKIKKLEESIEVLQGAKLKSADPNSFKDPIFDDTNWPEILVPQIWETQSIGEMDGVVWLRKTIMLPEGVENKLAKLSLSKIDDEDMTYVNGIEVGQSKQWDIYRNYTIDPGILKRGQNTIAVRVKDTGGGGGIYGDPDDVVLTIEDQVYSLHGKWKFQVESVSKTISENSMPSLCYNAMIHPIVPYAIKGFLWYQGESNVGRSYQYQTAFPLLVQDWRQKFNQGDIPFYFVQLASYSANGDSNDGCAWAELRESQSKTLDVANTGMVVTTDLVTDPKDIHPTNKHDVGKRLAMFALHNLYGKDVLCHGPTFKSMEVLNQEVWVTFDHIGSGLTTKDRGTPIKGFEIAGDDQIFYPANANITANKIIVTNINVLKPKAVRYAWIGDATSCNLFNIEGYPAVPFRSDDWKSITKDEKYSVQKND